MMRTGEICIVPIVLFCMKYVYIIEKKVKEVVECNWSVIF